ncbi:hypothetical protein D3C73_841100 [compost metagenome]
MIKCIFKKGLERYLNHLVVHNRLIHIPSYMQSIRIPNAHNIDISFGVFDFTMNIRKQLVRVQAKAKQVRQIGNRSGYGILSLGKI